MVAVQVPTFEVRITHHAYAKYAKDFFEAARICGVSEGFSPVPYYLYCHSIELALKALVINVLPEKIHSIHRKTEMGHDLLLAVAAAEAATGSVLLDESDKSLLVQASQYYGNDKKKGFEYFSGEIKASMLRGFEDLPSLPALQAVSSKLIELLVKERVLLS